jgi:hypothetical protein
VVADFSTRSVRPLGAGKPDLANPFTVFSFGDTAYVADWAAAKVTVWGPSLTVLGWIPAPPDLRGSLPRARDAAGRLYFEVPPPPSRDGSSNRDSAALVRALSGFTRFDTVGRLSPLDLAEVEDQAGRRFERRVFSGTDQWGVLRDGSIWVARVYHNRIDWVFPDGRQRRGPALPDRVIEVTSTDREHWLLQFPEELRSTAERLPFSPLKPPFTKGLTTPAGEIWLEKSRQVVDTVQTYHVLDGAGALRYVAVLPMRQGHVIALGHDVALVAEQYAEGVRLMQAAIPRPAASTGGR